MSFKQIVSWILVLLCPGYSWFVPSDPAKFAGRIKTNESYYYVGETITLHCYAEKEFADVKFIYLNRTVVPKQHVKLINNTYARMEKVAEATDPNITSYDCWLDFNKRIAVASQVIETEYRPQNVTNVTCVYYNKMNVFCTWDIGVQYKHASDVNVDPEWSSNPDVPNNWRSCSSSNRTACTINNYNNIFLSIRVNVTNRRRHDTAVLQYDINNVNHLIKTEPVQNLQITNVTSTCVSLSWRLLYSAMEFIVQYSVTGSQNYSLMITRSQGINICNLRPNSLYTFVVKTRPIMKGYFSDPSVINVQTKEDAPYSGPRITKGGYFRKPCTVNSSQVIVYFQPVKDEYKNGRVANYCAAVALDSGVHWTSCIDPEVSNQFVFGVNVTCNESFTISMYANTRVGSSPREILSVPEMLKELENKTEQMDLQIMESEKGLYVATWNPLADENMYTLFLYYCKESRMSKICKGPVEYQRVNISSGKHEIWSEEADIFGLSLVMAENLTSGIYFTDCVYNPTSREIRKPKKPSCRWKSTHVKVKWTYERCDFSKKVKAQGYILKICRKKSSDPCIVYNIDNGSQFEFDVSDLQPWVEYTVTVTAKTTSGLSEESDPASIPLNPRTEDIYNIDNGSQFEFDVSDLQSWVEYTVAVTAKTTSGLSEESDTISTPLNPRTEDKSNLSVTVVSLAICTLTLFIILVITVIYNKREKLISVVMKKRNISQIAVNSGTEEHEIPDIDPLEDNASRVYSEIRESFLDKQNQDIDYLSIINDPIDDQLNHYQAIYYEIPENQSAIGVHLTSGKQDYLHACFDTSLDTVADKPSYLHPIELSQIDDDKLDYLHLHQESNSDEEMPVYQQLRHDLNNGQEVLHTTEMSQACGDRLNYSSLHQECNSDEERPVYQQLSHDFNSGHVEPVVLNQLQQAVLSLTYVSDNEIGKGNLGNHCPSDVKHNQQDEI